MEKSAYILTREEREAGIIPLRECLRAMSQKLFLVYCSLPENSDLALELAQLMGNMGRVAYLPEADNVEVK